MKVKKAALIALGTVFVALGVIGMFLPLMPTTVFLLLAAYCYSKSSDRFHDWLLNNKWCGPYIRNYKDGRGMTVRNKVQSIGILWISIAFSIWLVSSKLWLVILLLAIATAITVHLLWIKTYRPDDEEIAAEMEPVHEN